MAKTKISEFSATANSNTDINSINIAEGCAPSNINDAIRELMAELKDFQAGTKGDSFNGPVGTTTAAAGAFTTLTTSSTVTHNGGTANGVAYLNGSKVLTTGSALTFDGTSVLSNTVATGTTPTTPAEIRAATSTSGSGWSTTAPWARFSYYSADTSDSGPKVQIAMDAISSASTGGLSDWVLSTANVTTGALVERYRVVSDSGNSIWSIGGSEAMRLTSTGLGIGTSSPSEKLQVNGSSVLFQNTSGAFDLKLYQNSRYDGRITVNSSGMEISQRQGLPLLFLTSDIERARITSGGDLYINTTSAIDSAYKVQLYFASGGGITIKTGTNGDNAMGFRNSSGTSVGSIVINASSTAYNTSSDYRLKNTIAPMTGALAKVAQLKPCTYKWNADGSDGEGFIAHELAEVVPQCVTGAKDAVDEDGNPVYQGIDTSFLAGLYAAALQELMAEVNSLKAEIAALKA